MTHGDKTPGPRVVAAPGNRYVVITLDIRGPNADKSFPSWWLEDPHIRVDSSRDVTVTATGSASSSPQVTRWTTWFEVPADARSLVFAFTQKLAGGPVSFRLR